MTREEAIQREKEWRDETSNRLGEVPGGHNTERIESQRGRKRWIHRAPEDDGDTVPEVENIIDQMEE